MIEVLPNEMLLPFHGQLIILVISCGCQSMLDSCYLSHLDQGLQNVYIAYDFEDCVSEVSTDGLIVHVGSS